MSQESRPHSSRGPHSSTSVEQHSSGGGRDADKAVKRRSNGQGSTMDLIVHVDGLTTTAEAATAVVATMQILIVMVMM